MRSLELQIWQGFFVGVNVVRVPRGLALRSRTIELGTNPSGRWVGLISACQILDVVFFVRGCNLSNARLLIGGHFVRRVVQPRVPGKRMWDNILIARYRWKTPRFQKLMDRNRSNSTTIGIVPIFDACNTENMLIRTIPQVLLRLRCPCWIQPIFHDLPIVRLKLVNASLIYLINHTPIFRIILHEVPI